MCDVTVTVNEAKGMLAIIGLFAKCCKNVFVLPMPKTVLPSVV